VNVRMAPQEKDPTGPNHNEHRLIDAVGRMRSRRERWERTGEWPLARALGMMGRFGWTIVGPAVLGAFVGRWLDQRFQSGVFWSATLVFLGVTAGFYLVWKRMHTE
jgi:ATP synthase protein I